jgi:RNA polymerase sigma-70 factor (ECF subfamily)
LNLKDVYAAEPVDPQSSSAYTEDHACLKMPGPCSVNWLYLQTQEVGAESLTCTPNFVFGSKMAEATRVPFQDGSPAVTPKGSLDELVPVIYGELRRMAFSFLQRERQNHTLQPTALAHEVYLRLVKQRQIDTHDRAQFFGLAAEMMRRILINYAEAHRAAKRGPEFKLSLEDPEPLCRSQQDVDILALNEALGGLAALDPEKRQIVELRFFGGLTMAEIAVILGKSLATVERQWILARAWLYREIRVNRSLP